MSSLKRIQKEIMELNYTLIEVISARPDNESDLYHWTAYIMGPADSPYEGGIFKVNIHFKERYPFEPPILTFVTRIYHPNINSNGTISINLLEKDEWKPNYTISNVLLWIKEILKNPDFDEDIVPEIGSQGKRDYLAFKKKAQEWTLKYAIPSKYIFEYGNLENKHLLKEIKNLELKLNQNEKLLNDKENEIKKLNEKIKELSNLNIENEKKLKLKEKELKEIKSLIPFEISQGEKLMTIIFTSFDENIHCSFICKNTDKYSKLENLLRDQYPEYLKEDDYYFIANKNKIKRNITLEENHIKNNDIIILYKLSNS